MKIYVKKIEGVTLPQRGSELAAGYDIVATSEPKIVGEPSGFGDLKSPFWKRIDYIEYETNLFIAPSAKTFHTLIHPRSSVSKYNLVLANSIGLVDNDYRGMVICRFKYIWQPEDYRFTNDLGNLTLLEGGNVNVDRIYKKGDKIAQLVFEPTVQVDFELVDDLNETDRGAGGFGSTDLPTIKGKLQHASTKNNYGRIYPKTESPTISDDGDVIKIRASQPTVIETVEPPPRKYDVEKPFSKTGKSSILEKWKEKASEPVVSYEKLVKERENPQ